MAEPDNRAIREAFSDDEFATAFNQFTDSQYLYFPDYNNSSYTSGIVRFDSLATRDQFVVWSDSYVSIPVQIQAAGAVNPYTAFDPIAFKTSILSMITSVQINSGSGQTLVNDVSCQYINNIRLLLEASYESQFSNLQDIQFWKDQYLPSFVGATNAGSWGSVSAAYIQGNVPAWATTNATTQSTLTDEWQFGPSLNAGAPVALTNILNINQNYNEGMSQRVKWFKQASSFAGGIYSLVCNIPLSLIHPFFAQLNFPLINARFQINLTTPFLNAPGGTTAMSNNTPFVVGLTDATRASAAQALMTVPSAAIATASNGNGSLSNCRIYYRKVVYSPELITKINSRLQSGFRKNIEYSVTDFYPNVVTTNNTSLSAQTTLISSATVAPLRVYMLVMPTGQNVSSFLPMIFPFDFTNVNVIINNTPYYYNAWQTDYDAWKILKENTVAHGYEMSLGATIGFEDFQSQYHIYLMDVHRLKDRLAAPNEAVNIQMQWTRVNNGTAWGTAGADYLFLVERQQVAQFNISSSEVAIAIGSASV